MPDARAPITFMHLPSLSRSHSQRKLIVAACMVAFIAGGCSTRRPAPVEDRATNQTSNTPVLTGPTAGAAATPSTGAAIAAPPPTYTVKRGDTLHQIALDTGLDYKELAAWNNIENVNVIRVGQVLRLTAPGLNFDS